MDFININTIKIPKAFMNSKPKKNKIERIRDYCQKNGCIDKPEYIYGKFKGCDKLYIWKVKDSIDVKVNDEVVVQNKKSKGVVTVVDIFTLDGMKNVYYYAKHRDVIKVCNEGGVCSATK